MKFSRMQIFYVGYYIWLLSFLDVFFLFPRSQQWTLLRNLELIQILSYSYYFLYNPFELKIQPKKKKNGCQDFLMSHMFQDAAYTDSFSIKVVVAMQFVTKIWFIEWKIQSEQCLIVMAISNLSAAKC